MRIDLIKLLISMAICFLLSFAFYHYRQGEQRLLLGAGLFLELLLTLLPAIGIRFIDSRKGVLIKTTALVFAFVFLILAIIFFYLDFSAFSFILINGLSLLIYLLIVYNLNRKTF